MKKSDIERIKKIVYTWEALQKQIKEHSITKEQLLNGLTGTYFSEN